MAEVLVLDAIKPTLSGVILTPGDVIVFDAPLIDGHLVVIEE